MLGLWVLYEMRALYQFWRNMKIFQAFLLPKLLFVYLNSGRMSKMNQYHH